MIQIKKPAEIPKKLAVNGKAETEKNKRLFEESEDAFRLGEKTFEFDSEIYGHQSVKTALCEAQHGKCCFCEGKQEIGDVEHFRPKGGYQQERKDKISKPGYYWLAYTWDNLFFCCPKCNRSYKKNLFPLLDPSKRATSHSDAINEESPLFVHPEKENPEDFIEFKGPRPRAVNGNRKGEVTIREIGLDRPFLDGPRDQKYRIFKILYKILELEEINEEIKKLLNEALEDSAEFAAMIRCAIRDKFRF